MDRTIKVASLFCGCGGTDIGMEGNFDYLGKHYDATGMKIVYANDIEKSACDLFEANLGLKPDNRDIREVNSDELPEFDILTSGFPCQSFSIIAQNPPRLGIKDDRGKLFFEVCRILRERQPKCFIAENVKGLLTVNDHQTFPLILDEFEKSGYNVKWQIMRAVEYGIPQKRERVIIVGFRKDLNIDFQFPVAVTPMENQYVPLKKILQDSFDDKYWFSQRAVDGMMKNRASMNKGRAQDIEMPCNTVGAHLAKVSLNSTDPVLFQNGRYRRFTPREVARIQSFPDSFKLFGSEGAQYRALGNAIPPVMFWYVAEAIRKALKEADSLNGCNDSSAKTPEYAAC
jgi:DNA (cytosine-5)-methyltransferase 1